jgi:hypothetical protein
MESFKPDEDILKKIAERVMFDSVHEEVDVTDPKARHELVSEVAKAVVYEVDPSASPELVEEYVNVAMSDMYRDEAIDEIGPQGYFDRIRGARANEYRNPSHK